jgi:hypothetical protein
MSADFDLRDIRKLGDKISGFIGNYQKNMEQYQKAATEKLLAKVIQHASGRPGPNIVTGQYVAAFLIEDGKIVNLSPQTHRLEYGFVGEDSLGRHYYQPPFPHFRPALEEMRQEYGRGIVLVIKQTWRDS